MAITKDRITPFRDSLSELSRLGSPVDLEVAAEETRSCRLEIEQVGDSRIFELADGRCGFMLEAAVINQTSRTMYILNVGLHLGWDEKWMQWLEPQIRKERNHKDRRDWEYTYYKFPGKLGWVLPSEGVINHQLTPNRGLPPHRPISGWLLGTGGLMPRTLFKDCPVEASLVITTWDRVEHSGLFLLAIERLGRKAQRPGPRPSLFADPVQDPKPKKEPRIQPKPIGSQDQMERRDA